MILLKRVLVATDFSPGADAALTYGRALAHRFDATLHVIHVVENDFFRPTVADPRAIMSAKTRALNDRLTEEDLQTLRARAPWWKSRTHRRRRSSTTRRR